MNDEQLIKAVRSFPCLRRVSSKGYKYIRAKENSWKEVAKLQDDSSPEECAKCWKQLWEKYIREKKKTRGKSGDAGPVIISCWPLYEVMDFLRETVRHKRTVTNFKSDEASLVVVPLASGGSSHHTLSLGNPVLTATVTSRESSPNCNSDIEEIETPEISVTCDSPVQATTSSTRASTPSTRCTTPARSSSTVRSISPPSRPSKKRKKMHDPIDEFLMSEIQKLSSERDESSAFGDHVDAKLRRFSHQQKARACMEINHVLYDIEF